MEASATWLPQALRFRLVPGSLPGPMWRVEMKADHKGLSGFCIPVHYVDRTTAEQSGQIAHLMDQNIVVPEIFPSLSAYVGKIVRCTTAKSVVMIVAASQRAKLWQSAQTPFAHHRRAITGLLQLYGQRRIFRRQAPITLATAPLSHPH